MKPREFEVWFRRPPEGAKEIGPQDEFQHIGATSKTAVTKIAKEVAKRKGWRFMEVNEPENDPFLSSTDLEIAINL